ncbi:class A beta-lactamase-related serine hydrolase [Aquimarina sp. BL5]|uniref:serine hydrolase domain-containing protein n=1 Tax=Aquimarina sp. BL5 TaxID=1714860 RepID=UPI000E4BFB7A|nr:serine hydrolase domain-containing protein [Aquimarina sp. BL5]AXT53338.1 class A beta-lactamase-related serine hydrolase [Aquimarina sp. BL5]RKN06201.1 class A beta-lactamase-related serine hydrolase [Aquimarina sp. BL5]
MKNRMTLFYSVLLSLILSCSDGAEEILTEVPNPDQSDLYFPPIDSEAWETTTISDLGWNAAAEQPLLDFLDEKDTKAFIILKNGKIAVEKYFNGGSVSDNNPWYSAGKTLTAFTVGLAQQEGLLDINEPSSTYLGTQWADITTDQEQAITVRNHLTMTTGLDYTNILLQNCTNFDCLTYLNEPGSFWYYHNAAYTLLTDIVAGAVNTDYNTYFDTKLKNKIGMNGAWVSLGYTNIYYSTARSMARFGLLNLNKGTWNTTEILTDQNYFTEMTTTSQNLNPSYGYLWWLNGKSSFRAPAFENEFPGELMPDAPNDLIAGLGKNDQKLYIVPSKNLVIIRMGDDTGQALLGPSSFDNNLWIKINALTN